MAKDALGHGSDGKGAGMHSQGVQKAGMRYHVKVSPYSLDASDLGKINGAPVTISMHNSLAAAGRSLGSVISHPEKVPLTSNGGREYLIHDQMTGAKYTRNGARTGTTTNQMQLSPRGTLR